MSIETVTQRRPRRPAGPGRLDAIDAALLPERLLDAAQAVFVQTGYARATMDAIAQAAGTTRKTLYARHTNKAEVLAAVVNRLLDRALASAGPSAQTRAAPDGAPRAVLRSLARELAELSSAPGVAGLNRLILAEAAQVPELARLFSDLYQRAARAVGARLQSLQAQGHLRPLQLDSGLAAAMFIEMACSLPRLYAVMGQPMSQRRIATHTGQAVSLFLAAYGRRTATR